MHNDVLATEKFLMAKQCLSNTFSDSSSGGLNLVLSSHNDDVESTFSRYIKSAPSLHDDDVGSTFSGYTKSALSLHDDDVVQTVFADPAERGEADEVVENKYTLYLDKTVGSLTSGHFGSIVKSYSSQHISDLAKSLSSGGVLRMILHTNNDWYERSGTFDIVDSFGKETRDALIQSLQSIPIQHANRIYKRMVFLEEVTEEEYPNSARISNQSLSGFLHFVSTCEFELHYPDITITPDGNVTLEWESGDENYLVIEFLSVQDASIVLVSPKENTKGKVTTSVFHNVAVSSLFKFAPPPSVLSWITE
jgi:hypothetical protein